MKSQLTPEQLKKRLLDKMIDAGLETVNLCVIAQETTINRQQLRDFLAAALKVLNDDEVVL